MNVFAPMVGKVVSVSVNEGEQIKMNDVVATIEAMKMYVKIYSPSNGVVKDIKISPGDTVNTESVVMTII